MNRAVVVMLVLVLAVSLGCGSKQTEEEQDLRTEAPVAEKGLMFDPVDGEPVDIRASEFSYVYGDTEYHFNSRKNMEEFKKDPQKYLGALRR